MNPLRILVVDDSVAWRSVVLAILRKGNWCVAEASGGFEAIQRSTEFKPNLVLLDLSLPDLSGFEAVQRIGAAAPDCQILLFSDTLSPTLLGEALRVGAGGCIRKSDAVVELLPAMRALLHGEKFVPHSMSVLKPEQLS